MFVSLIQSMAIMLYLFACVFLRQACLGGMLKAAVDLAAAVVPGVNCLRACCAPHLTDSDGTGAIHVR